MFGLLGKQFQALVDSVLDPVWKWVISRSWIFRASLVVIILGAFGAWQKPEVVQGAVDRARFAYRVETSEQQTIPLSNWAANRLSQALNRLGDTIENDLLPESRENQTSWSMSQTLVAAQHLSRAPADPDVVVEFIRKARVPSCFCWTELPTDNRRTPSPHISGWVMTALAGMKRGLDADEIKSVLALQSPDGSWPIFVGADRNTSASTYATAWMTLGLQRQAAAGLVDPALRSRVSISVRRGARWLLQKREPNGRWKPYPARVSSKPSEAISGLVMHVLHEVGVPEIAALDRQWLANLPGDPVEANAMENNYVEVPTEFGTRIDHWVQLTAPWMMAATADAYAAGNNAERRRALQWLERSLSRPSFETVDSDPNNWWRAEVAIGMAHLHRTARCDRPPCRPDAGAAP